MNLQAGLYLLMALLAGSLGGIHVPINGALGKQINSTFVATFVFYGVGFLLISLICLVTYDRQAFSALATVPRWYFIAGVISVVVVGSSTFLIPRVGALNVFVVVLIGQMTVRTLISHFGLLESPVSPITGWKILGGLFLLVGTILVIRN